MLDKERKELTTMIVGGGGLGTALADVLVTKYNSKVIIVDNNLPEEKNQNKDIEYVYFDLAKDDITNLAGYNINALIITAGIGRLSFFDTFTVEEIKKNFKINVESIIQLIKLYYSKINSIDDFYCAIVSSIAGIVATPLYSVYSATKAALVKFVEGINAELTFNKVNNRILNVAPGRINGTNFHNQTPNEEDLNYLNSLSEEILDKMITRNNLFIPKYEDTYKNVIKRYIDNEQDFAVSSLEYKLSNSKLNDTPQVKIGYLSGTFDLFHIGHLNLIKRAKRYCDKLIVGVHPNANHKNKQCFIPLDERLEIIKSISYVDEAIICSNEDIDDYDKIKYDFLFVGSDYKGTERFNRYEEYFKDKDVQIIYLPYTTKTSSTKLRQVLDESIKKENK